MSQPEYFGCMGCGRVFKLNDEEIYEYGLHVCEPEMKDRTTEDK